MNSLGELAVVLLQLGGPDSLSAVEPFLFNLFSDPDIINFPGAFLARKPLARFIAARRSRKVAEHYREIGGRSPIVELTLAQGRALEAEVRRTLDASVHVAMRYWHPLSADVIQSLKERRVRKIILLPLYPQYSQATTASSIKEWNRQTRLLLYDSPPSETVCCYHNHPMYVGAIVERINSIYGRFAGCDPADVDLIFSAHGVPLTLVESGDPYQQQILETVKLVMASGGWTSPSTVCYQSKVGPAKWLKPSLNETLRDLASRGRRNFLVVPVAFVTEHIETLHEINIEARREAARLGVSRFEMMPALNDSPLFIRCLSDLVHRNA